jgi:tetratricopeptide (TPR) repeat protein
MKLKHLFLTLILAVLANVNLNAQSADYNKEDCDKYRSLYFQYLKQNMFRDAMTFWAMAYNYCGGIDSLDSKFFVNARVGYMKLYSAEQDPKLKVGLRDTIYWIYESLIVLDPANPDWKAKYATMLVTEEDTRYGKIDSLYQQSLHLQKTEAFYYDIRQYFKHLIVNKYNKAPDDKKEDIRSFIIEEYMLLSDYCSGAAVTKRAAADEEGAKKYDDAQEFLDKYFLQIVTDCNVLVNVLDKKLTTLPQVKDAKSNKVNSYLALLDKKKCQSTPTYAKLLDTLISIDPNANAYYKTGIYYLSNDQAEKAVDYFQKAVDMEGAGANKDEYLYNLALSQYASKKFRAAFNTAKMVEGTNKGKALKICGDAIAATANGCGETTFERKANYWLANDYYRKAAALGADVSTSRFLDSAPTDDEIFSEGKTKGSSITLSCWGESTTIR